MKFDGFSFPHPVLGIKDDIEGVSSVDEIKLDEMSNSDNYILNIKYKLSNIDLEEMITKKSAFFHCELNCSSTLFRKSYLSDTSHHEIWIPKDYVRDKVELLFTLISTHAFSNYQNSKAHCDFLNFKFDIDNGDVLAYLGKGYFIAGISYHKLKAVSSFMEIEKGENETGDYNVILDNPKILIKLSKNDYIKYCDSRIGKNRECATIFHSSIVLPTLIHALYQLTINDDLKDKSWAIQIFNRLDNDELFIGLSLNEDNILKISQLILGMPIERLLNDLYFQLNTKTDTDN
ncbi:MAG: hypothetical protein WC644_04115 [Ignavibacteria bacterium]